MPKNFEYNKQDFDEHGNEIFRVVICETRGVRDPNYDAARIPRQRPPEDDLLSKVRWVSIEGTGFDTKSEKLYSWLDFFGERLSNMQVETLEFADTDNSEPKTVEWKRFEYMSVQQMANYLDIEVLSSLQKIAPEISIS